MRKFGVAVETDVVLAELIRHRRALLTLCTESLSKSKVLGDLKTEFERACELSRQYEALSDAEKAERAAKNEAYMMRLIEELKSEERTGQVKKDDADLWRARTHYWMALTNALRLEESRGADAGEGPAALPCGPSGGIPSP